MLENRNTHLGQVPGHLPRHISYYLMENTLCQLWCQRLAGNTVAFLLAFHCLQVYVQPARQNKYSYYKKNIQLCAHLQFPNFNVLFLFHRVNCYKT